MHLKPGFSGSHVLGDTSSNPIRSQMGYVVKCDYKVGKCDRKCSQVNETVAVSEKDLEISRGKVH